MEGERKGSEKEKIVTTDLNYHLQTRELEAQKEKDILKKTNIQIKLNPQILQTKPTNQPTNPQKKTPQQNKIHKIPREKNLCIFKRKYPKD